ncbi:unnamed protein product [Musa acuminata subsp. malaccensis]|uniref:30S ribosomal protein 3, chloroplastic n=1 Tax=Musa acuminata subsp. malaccensis TaxID=214687 RepID=A0A804HY07_MUSAM|nr:PREDICTED: 30S ribosomal protein 3, chloroplastic-like [Musa acuminata subsp. malaccensis]CAG1860597.1 unnamed protein product [Musa acuminata subsp. malaccensis]
MALLIHPHQQTTATAPRLPTRAEPSKGGERRKMQSLSFLTAQPILPIPQRRRLASPKPLVFFSSFSSSSTTCIISLSQGNPKCQNASARSQLKRLTPLASTGAGAVLDDSSDASRVEEAEQAEEKQKLGMVVKPPENPRLVLRFMWMEKNIGLALDQVIPGHGAIPLSPYYFWPRKDAWEELKSKIEAKPWISQKRMIILLNQATDIINLWQQSGGNL